MLERLRAAQSTWVGKAVLGIIFLLIIVGLSFFGIADLFRSVTGTWVASVGGTEVSAESFRQAYSNELQQLQRRLKRPVTNAQAHEMGLEQQVLSRLVTDALLDRQAKALGLAISDPQIAKAITDDPTFAGADGHFDHAKFTELLRDNGMNEQMFVRDQRSTYLRQEVVDSVAGAMTAPTAAVEALHDIATETRSIDMIVLMPSLAGDIAAPDEATLQKFYEDRKQQFAAPEYRKLTVLAVTPAAVAKPDAVTDAEIEKAYETAPENRFGAPERRTVQQILFPTQGEAEAAALRITAGTPFGAVAAERNVTGKDLDLGTVTKGQIFDPAVADAAFSLPADGTSGPVKGTFGDVLVHVTAITPGDRKPLAEVAPILRKEIAEEAARTRDALRDIRDKIEDERSSGKPLAEAAKAAGLEVKTIAAIDRNGRDPSGATVGMADRDQVLRAAFASDVGVDNDIIQTRTGDQIWFEVASIEPAHQREFTTVRAEVEAAWRKDETAKRLAAKADDLVKQLGSGSTMEQVAASAGNAEVRHVGDLRRTGGGNVSPAVVAQAFDMAVGAAGSAEGDDGTRIVLKLLDSVVPPLDPAETQAQGIARQYRTMLADDVLTSYLTRLQDSVGVKVNPEALRTATGTSG